MSRATSPKTARKGAAKKAEFAAPVVPKMSSAKATELRRNITAIFRSGNARLIAELTTHTVALAAGINARRAEQNPPAEPDHEAAAERLRRRVEKRWPLEITGASFVPGDGLPMMEAIGLLALGIVRTEALWRELQGDILASEAPDADGTPATARAAAIGAALAMAPEIVRRRVLRGFNAHTEPDAGLSFPMLPGLSGLAHWSWEDIANALATVYVSNAASLSAWLIPRVQDGALRVELAEALMVAEAVAASFLVNTGFDHHAGSAADPTPIQERAWSAMAVALGMPPRV